MTNNYIELLSLIKESRLIEGFGTKSESALMIVLLQTLLNEERETTEGSLVTEKHLLDACSKYNIALNTNDLNVLINTLNSTHSTLPSLDEELLEKLHAGLTDYFQKSSTRIYQIYNYSIIALILVAFVGYFTWEKITNPAVAKITYYSNKDLEGAPFIEEYGPLPEDINFGMDAPKKGMPNDNFSIRYESDLISAKDSVITLSTISDDGLRIFIDGTIVMDYWLPQNSIPHGKSIPLSAGKHRLKIEYFEALVGAKLSVKITSNLSDNIEFQVPD